MNVLASRYASERMQRLWSAQNRVVLERRLWLAVLRAQQRLGVAVDDGVIADYEAVLESVDLASIAKREERNRHDVKARIEEFCALAGHEQIHLAMTSRDLTENVEQLQIVESLRVIRDDLVAVIARLGELAETHSDTMIVARTHNVAAQATTLGKRFADAASETILGYERVSELLARYPLRGIKGPVGTRLDQLDLLGSAAAVDELERVVAQHLGFERVLATSGQVYPRSLDTDVVAALVFAVSGPASLAVTLRLMAGHGLVAEGFREGQVASSAMPHKSNARSCERVGALRTLLEGHLSMAAGLAGRQWNEGDVSCSAVRRVVLPDAFYAADGLLHTALEVLTDLRVDTEAIEAECQRWMPLLATTRLLTVLTMSGLGRETAHELLAESSRLAAQSARSGTPVDLAAVVERVVSDPRTTLDRSDLLRAVTDRAALTGTAVEQTKAVVTDAQVLANRHPEAATRKAEVRF